jgi:hypothetical protein
MRWGVGESLGLRLPGWRGEVDGGGEDAGGVAGFDQAGGKLGKMQARQGVGSGSGFRMRGVCRAPGPKIWPRRRDVHGGA